MAAFSNWMVCHPKRELRHPHTYNLENSPGTLLTTGATRSAIRNRNALKALFSVEDIAVIAQNESDENAISIAEKEIACLDELSLDGDVPDDVSDSE